MDGFKRPQRPTGQPIAQRPTPTVRPQPRVAPAAAPQPKQPQPALSQMSDLSLDEPHDTQSSGRPRRRYGWFIFGGLLLAIIGSLLAAYMWYDSALRPVNTADKNQIAVVVEQGDTLSKVATNLKQKGLIRQQLAFEIYAKLSGSTVKAGTCRLTPAQSAHEILAKLEKGCHDFKSVTFYPGATIEKPLYISPSATIDQTMHIKYRLKDAGYTDQQIAAALTKQYTGPLFADKPAGTTLEGYVFGETYYVKPDATAEETLQASFDHFYSVIEKDDLVAKFRKQELNLYQGIIMASIVQRELNCEGKPTPERKQRCYGFQQTIAQIFLKRYHEGISLGSDVTFIYAADMKGVTPTVDLDSPYNTRIHVGLPPGPIASPGELALKAVANPSDTDYLFFIAGDDGLIYFARTQAEHEANIRTHCQQLCNEL